MQGSGADKGNNDDDDNDDGNGDGGVWCKWHEVGRMGWKCLAVGDNTSPLKYSRFDAFAPWRGTRQTHEAYLAGLAGSSIPVLLSACIGFRIELVMADVLHCVDLGIASHIVGQHLLDHY